MTGLTAMQCQEHLWWHLGYSMPLYIELVNLSASHPSSRADLNPDSSCLKVTFHFGISFTPGA